MRSLIILLFLCYVLVDSKIASEFDEETIFGDLLHNLIYTKSSRIFRGAHHVHSPQNQLTATSVNDRSISVKVNYFSYNDNQLKYHRLGKHSNIVVTIISDLYFRTPKSSSAVYISYDNGDTFENKTSLFVIADDGYVSLDSFYHHPKYDTHFVFTDDMHKTIYVSKNHGRNVKRINLEFTPSDISFHELAGSSVFVVLDKKVHSLWITGDFGQSFRQIGGNFIEAFHWINNALVLERMDFRRNKTILYSKDLFLKETMVHATDVKAVFVKDDYLFTTKLSSTGYLELYVSYKFGKNVRCVFDNRSLIKNYIIADVTNRKALVAVLYANTTSHLYVSENLDDDLGIVNFALSLQDVFCYKAIFSDISETFAEVYKVEGLSGIYIATRVLSKSLAPMFEDVTGSVITFDHGHSWHLIQAPELDMYGQPINCSIKDNCSLQMNQESLQLYPNFRTFTIFSSASAPGIIIAIGVLGESLQSAGVYSMYISDDAGLTWKQTLRDLHLFNMGDYGGILVATRVTGLDGTRRILYSIDKGKNWKEEIFYQHNINFQRLLTEPDEETTVFTIVVTLPKEKRWAVFKIDMKGVFQKKCTTDDYKSWSPNLIQKLTFKRRKSDAKCYHGENFDPIVNEF